VSLCRWDRRTGRPARLSQWKPLTRELASKLAEIVLRDVGESDMVRVDDLPQGIALHVRRAMTEAEEAGIAHIIRARRAGLVLP